MSNRKGVDVLFWCPPLGPYRAPRPRHTPVPSDSSKYYSKAFSYYKVISFLESEPERDPGPSRGQRPLIDDRDKKKK
jgi:hypothetical protein